MPAFIKTKYDEQVWKRAKQQASKTLKPTDPAYWALVTTIYKKMKGGK